MNSVSELIYLGSKVTADAHSTPEVMCHITLAVSAINWRLRVWRKRNYRGIQSFALMGRTLFDHFERRDEGDWVSACKNMVVPGNVGKGKPRKRWRDVLEDDLKKAI